MKGIILAGGNGTRLRPLTKVINKHLLPIYNRPMIYYPIETLKKAGVSEILVIAGIDHAGDFSELLGSGKEFGCEFTFRIQEEAGGIAQALALAEKFVCNDSCAVILGDNLFEDDFSASFSGFSEGAAVFVKEVSDPHRFGVVEFAGDHVVSIEEKPKNPKSNWAQTGLYLYDPSVFQIIKTLKPSGRGELEITDVNNEYLRQGLLKAEKVKGEWKDAGTFESLLLANQWAAGK